MADLTGRTLGNYRIIERIGRGGMATVYKAYQPALERNVAIKVMHDHLAQEDEQFAARFQREAKAVATLRHPNIVQVFDFGTESDISYMVMEFLTGHTLKTKLNVLAKQNEIMPLREAQRIFQSIANAVEYAFGQGMVHRDLKPDNVMLTDKGDVVLTDFGIAKIVGGTQYTATGAMMGTPAYISPEQGRGERGDARSDIYALGVILYEMVTDKVPFEADTPLAVIFKHISDPLPLPREMNPDLPESVERVILKALSKDPDDRYQHAAKMSRALADALSEEGVDLDAVGHISPTSASAPQPPTPTPPPTPAPPPPVAPATVASAAPPPSPQKGIPPWIWATGGLILGALVVLGILWALGIFGGGEDDYYADDYEPFLEEFSVEPDDETYDDEAYDDEEYFTTEGDFPPINEPFGLIPPDLCGPGEYPLYFEDFEDGRAQGWREIMVATEYNVENGWFIDEVEDGNLGLVAAEIPYPTSNFLPRAYKNAVWRLRVKFRGQDLGMGLNWKHGYWTGEDDQWNEWRYMIVFGGGIPVELSRYEEPGPGHFIVTETGWFLPEDEWHFFEVSTFEGVTQVWINGEETIWYEDPHPLPPGVISLEVYIEEGAETAFFFDDFSVCGLEQPFQSIIHSGGADN